MKGPADSDVVLHVLKGCWCSYEFLSFLFQTHSLKISFSLAIKHTYKHHCPYSPFLFLLLSSSSVHWEQSRASALSVSAEVKKTSLLPHERDLVTSESTLITQKQIFFLNLAAIFSHNYTLTVFFPFRCTSECHFLTWLQGEEHDRLILAFRTNMGDIYLPHFIYSKSIACHWWSYISSMIDLPLFECNCRLIWWLMPREIQT